MAKCHLGVVLFAFNNSGLPTGASFNVYTADNQPILKLNFRDVDDAQKGVALMQQLVDLAESIAPVSQ